MIILLTLITILLLVTLTMRFLVKDFSKFIIQKTGVPSFGKTFVDFGEYFATWFITITIALFGYWFYKFGQVLTSYFLTNDLIEFFRLVRSVYTVASKEQNPFTFQHFIAGFVLMPALQFAAVFVIYRSIKSFMLFVNKKYNADIYSEADLLYFSFAGVVVFMCLDILAYSQDIAAVSAFAHFIYLGISKLALIAYFMTVAHNHLLSSKEYKKTLPDYFQLRSLERTILYSPWKTIALTYLIGASLNAPFIMGTQFMRSNTAVIVLCIASCLFFFFILKIFLSNGYNFVGAVIFHHRINIESILVAHQPSLRKFRKPALIAAGIMLLGFLVYLPKMFVFILFVLLFLLLTFVVFFVAGYFASLGISVIRGKSLKVAIPEVVQPAWRYLTNTGMGFARSVSFPLVFMSFVTILIIVVPKTYHYTTDKNYVLSAVDTEGYPLIIAKGDQDNTIPVAYETLPPFFVKCLINQEDRSFFKQNSWLPNASTWHGISPAMLYRWFIGSGGGSNLNATLIKNIAFDGTFPADIQRKFAEAITGLQLSMQLSPEEIASQYVNKVAFAGGDGQSGVAMGSLNTFGLPVEKLNPAEIFYLVQTIKRGSSFKAGDTLINYIDAPNNKAVIKKALVEQATKWYEQDVITKKELNAIKGSELRFTNKEYKTFCKTSTNDFLKKQIGRDTSSKTFRSSISVVRQQAVYNGVEEFNNKFKDDLEKNGFTLFTAALVIDPHTGKILAHFGSDNIVDLTTLGNGSDMGSVMKPFVACELLESGFDANRISLYDGPVAGLKTPKDFGAYSFKYLGLDDALAQSRNASFVNVRLITDPIQLYKNVENRFRQMNLVADPYLNLNDAKRKEENILNYPLGSRNMRLLDIAQAYQVLFNQGRYIRLTPFTSYYDPYKDSTISITQETKQIYKPENADRIKSALHHTMLNGGTAFQLNEILKAKGRTFYAKTGTTANAKDGLCVLTDGNVLVISYISYGKITNNNLRLGLAEIPFGAAGKSAGVLSAIIYNHFSEAN